MIEFSSRGPFREQVPIVLASASPRRQNLLASLGIGFHVVPSTIKEPDPAPGCDPFSYALENAILKAQDIAAKRKEAVVIGADTVVVIDRTILGKPENAGHALEMLKMLCGRDHAVITGCCIIPPSGEKPEEFTVSTRVRMEEVSEEALHRYAHSEEPMDKAGGYAIQGIGGVFVKEICGSYSNVVGLPLQETAAALLGMNALTVCPAG
ncbi:MAG: Maf family protein [Desulfovibrionales bacterium]